MSESTQAHQVQRSRWWIFLGLGILVGSLGMKWWSMQQLSPRPPTARQSPASRQAQGKKATHKPKWHKLPYHKRNVAQTKKKAKAKHGKAKSKGPKPPKFRAYPPAIVRRQRESQLPEDLLFQRQVLNSSIAQARPKKPKGTRPYLPYIDTHAISYLHPLLPSNGAERRAFDLIFDRLCFVDAQGSRKLSLATSIQNKFGSDDKANPSLFITIRQGVRWHDRKALTAQDVAFSIKAYQRTAHTPFAQALRHHIIRVKVLAPHRLAVEYQYIYRLHSTTNILCQIHVLPAHLLGPVLAKRAPRPGDRFGRTPIGSGPYMLDHTKPRNNRDLPYAFRFGRGTKFKFRRQATHWRLYKHSHKYILTMNPSKKHGFYRSMLVKKGLQLTQAKGSASLISERKRQFYRYRAGRFSYLYFHPKHARDYSANVRLALLLALDRERIVERAFDRGRATVLSAPWLPSDLRQHAAFKRREQNTIKSAQLLAKEGWKANPKGELRRKGRFLALRLQVCLRHPRRAYLADALVEAWRDIGIAAIRVGTYFCDEATFKKRDDIDVLFHIHTPDERGGLQALFAADATLPVLESENPSPRTYTLFAALQQANTQTAWYKAKEALHKHLYTTLPIIPLWSNDTVITAHRRIKGLYFAPRTPFFYLMQAYDQPSD